MSIAITCSGCSASFDVPDTLAGKTIRCKACKTQLTVSEDASDTPEDETPQAVTQSQKAVKAEVSPKPVLTKKQAVKTDVSVDEDDEDEEESIRKKTNPNKSSTKPAAKSASKKRRDEDDDDDDDRPSKKKKAKKKSDGSGVMIAVIAGVVLALAAIGGVTFWLLSGDEKKKDTASSSDSKPSTSSPSSSSKPTDSSKNSDTSKSSDSQSSSSGNARSSAPKAPSWTPPNAAPRGGGKAGNHDPNGGGSSAGPPTGAAGSGPENGPSPGGQAPNLPGSGPTPGGKAPDLPGSGPTPGGKAPDLPGSGPAPGGKAPDLPGSGPAPGGKAPDLPGSGPAPGGQAPNLPGSGPAPGGQAPNLPGSGPAPGGQAPNLPGGGQPAPGGPGMPGRPGRPGGQGGGAGGMPRQPGGAPGLPGGAPGMGPGGIGSNQTDLYAPPSGAKTDGNLKQKFLDSFFTAAFDTEQKAFYTISNRLDKGKELGMLIWYDLPSAENSNIFERKGSCKIPHLATRATIDSSKGLLYIATVTTATSQSSVMQQQFDLASALGDVQIFDLKTLKEAANGEAKPLATIPINKTIRGLELSNDGKYLYVATTTTTKPITSTLLKIDTETRKTEKPLSLKEHIWEMRKTADGNSLLILFGPNGADKAAKPVSTAKTVNPDDLKDIKEYKFEGVANHIVSAPNSKKDRVAATVTGSEPANPPKVDLGGDDGTMEMQLGVGWRAANNGTTPGYVEYSPDGKMVFLSAFRAGGIDVFEVTDVDAISGWKKKASIRTAGNSVIGGHFFITPDGKYLIDHHGVVIETANVGGSNGEAEAVANASGAAPGAAGAGPQLPGIPGPGAAGPGPGGAGGGPPARPRQPGGPGGRPTAPAPPGGGPGGGNPPPAAAPGGAGAPAPAPGGGAPPPAAAPPKM